MFLTHSQLKYLCKNKINKSDIIRLSTATGEKIFHSYFIFDKKFIALHLLLISITISPLYNM